MPQEKRRPARRAAGRVTHLDATGAMHMVDVGAKPATARRARAGGFVRLSPEALAALTEGRLAKGDALAAARLAGIMAAKRTAEIIPLCHPLPLTHLAVVLTVDTPRGGIAIEAEARTNGPTGVEMEALTAVAGAALTLYDMAKAIDRGIVIESIQLLEKEGGRSGAWRRDALPAAPAPPARHVAAPRRGGAR